MTEAEWLACSNPGKMLEFLESMASDRKWRLVACACCRRIWHLLTDERSRKAVEAAEQFADGEIEASKLAAAHAAAWPVLTTSSDAAYYPGQAALCAAAPKPVRLVLAYANKAVALTQARHLSGDWNKQMEQGWAASCDLLREIYGNPFGPVSLNPAWLTSNGGTVPKLAQAIYDDRRFSDLPILADALEEAGCDNAEILAHCRQPGEQVRGCWVVDLLLGKS
jgi:hypothetical protein